MLPHRRFLVFALSSLCLLTSAVGCGSRSGSVAQNVAPVELILKQKGKPLSHVEVTLVKPGSDPGLGLNGQAGPNGVASLEGVPSGEYEVRIARNLAAGPDPAFEKYGAGTPLKAVVTETERSFTFEL